MTSRALIVMPAFNEATCVGAAVDDVIASGFDVLVVNDGSTDTTSHTATEHGARVLDLPINLGVGGALRVGFRWAVDHSYDLVVQCDADGQHLATEIDRLLDAQAATHADLVIGSRFAAGDPWATSGHRLHAMHLLARVASRAATTPISDASSGFRCISRPLLDEFAVSYPAQYLGDTFEALVVAARAGYRVIEVPSAMRERQAGVSSARSVAATLYMLRALIVTAGGLHFTVQEPR